MQITPAQGLFQYLNNVALVNDIHRVQPDVERLTDEAIEALSEARRHLKALLFVDPLVRLRAVWPLRGGTAQEFMAARTGNMLHPERVHPGIGLGFRLPQLSTRTHNPLQDGVAELKIEPFLRSTNDLWLEASFSRPGCAFPGQGVAVVGVPAESAADATPVKDCARRARGLLDGVREFFGLEES